MSDETSRMVQEDPAAHRPPGVLAGYLVMRDSVRHIASPDQIPAVAVGAMFGPSPHAPAERMPELLEEARREAFREAARAQAHADLDADKDSCWRIHWVAEVRRAATKEDEP